MIYRTNFRSLLSKLMTTCQMRNIGTCSYQYTILWLRCSEVDGITNLNCHTGARLSTVERNFCIWLYNFVMSRRGLVSELLRINFWCQDLCNKSSTQYHLHSDKIQLILDASPSSILQMYKLCLNYSFSSL